MTNNDHLADLLMSELKSECRGKPWCVWVQDQYQPTTYVAADLFKRKWTASMYASLIEMFLGRRCIVQENLMLLAAKSS